MSTAQVEMGARGRPRAVSGRRGFSACLVLALGLTVLGWSDLAQAESGARRAKLARMLRHSDFRVRTQAAFSLGRVGHPDAVGLLTKSLRDRHPAVRAAAATALGRLGDAGALPVLRAHRDSSQAVKSQVRRAISVIEEGQGPSARPPPPRWARARHYVELADINNVSKTKRPGLMKHFKAITLRELYKIPRAVVAEASSRPRRLDRRMRRHRLKGYRVSASLGRLVRYMGPRKVQVRAEVMLAVTSYPGHTYCMTVTGVEAVSESRRSFRSDHVTGLQDDAVAGALEQATSRLGGALGSGAALKCHGKSSASARRRRGRGRR